MPVSIPHEMWIPGDVYIFHSKHISIKREGIIYIPLTLVFGAHLLRGDLERLGGAPPITFQVLEKHLGTQPQPDVVVITVVVGGSWYPTHGGCRSHESYPPITRQ